MPSDAFTTLIAGGGPAAIEAALTLRERAPHMRVQLLAPDGDFVYRPLSVVEPFALSGVRRYPYARLAGLGVEVVQGRLAGVDAARHVVDVEDGQELRYDALLIALGARGRPPFEHSLTFRGPADIERMHGLVQDVEGGYIRSIAFVAPPGANWTLPLYELALQTADRANEMCLDPDITLVSHEVLPMEIFGTVASDIMGGLLARRAIRFASGSAMPEADRVVALPVPQGPAVRGLPADPDGFLAVDDHCRVVGAPDVWAAGDCTDHPLKQGGLATQQADTAAASIASAAGARPEEEPDDLVLRAMFVADRTPYFLRRRLDGLDLGQAATRALWWPPSKIAGRRLSTYLDRLDQDAGTVTFERASSEPHGKRLAFVPTEAA